ncbi:MAG: histidine kinase [Oleispira sp.]|nr:histidine kinase [Oleispira sp.]
MTTSLYFNPKIRKRIVHFAVLLFIIKYLFVSNIINLISTDFPGIRWEIYQNSIITITFYIHTFLLLPILLNKKKPVKFASVIFLGFLLVNALIIWTDAIRSTEITYYFTNTRPKPFDVFIENLNYMTSLLLFSYVPYLLISFVYYILTINKVSREKLFSLKHTELIVNAVVFISILFLFFIEDKSSNHIIKVGTVLGLLASVFYINTFVITPIFFKNSRKYFLLISLFLFFSIKVSQWTSFSIHFLNTNAINIIVLIIFVLSFIYGYVRIKLKLKEQIFNLKLGAKESELNLLKSQVNPHFLFNTLNTLYATALEENASKTSESIAKLASLIRYMQEDINKDFIPLKNEIKYLQDYITIQKLRCAVEPQIETNFENAESHSISPGLLIPFVENAFKYGVNLSKASQLKVSVVCDKNTIYFKCVNSYQEDYKTFEKEHGFGIGIKNAKQRLELVYPKEHTFEIVKEKSLFSVLISINTEK